MFSRAARKQGTGRQYSSVRGKQLQEREWVEGAGNRGEESRLCSGLFEKGKRGWENKVAF